VDHYLIEVHPLTNDDGQAIGAQGKCACGKRMASFADDFDQAKAAVEACRLFHARQMETILART